MFVDLPSEYLSKAEARELYRTGDSAHDFDHVLRVTHLAVHIAQAEGADETVTRLAALLHDVPTANGGRQAHHVAAAAFAAELLHQRQLAPDRIANVVHSIQAHRFRDRSVQPATLEARCLYDADKLDSMGAIGLARVFAYAGAHGTRLWTEPWPSAPPFDARPTGAEYTPVHEYVYKLQRLLDTLFTPTARRLGAARHAFMAAYFDQLDAEMRGSA